MSLYYNTKHSDTEFFVLWVFFFANCPIVSKYTDVLPDITQIALCLCHILLRYLVSWKQSMDKVENSVKTEPRA